LPAPNFSAFGGTGAARRAAATPDWTAIAIQLPRFPLGPAQAGRSPARRGRTLDDRDREDEADLIVAAERLTFDVMAQLIRDCSGIVRLCLTADRLTQLDLPVMVARNQSYAAETTC